MADVTIPKLRKTIAGDPIYAKVAEYDSAGNLISGQFDTINGVIPSGASSSNKLATANDVAAKQDILTFNGTYNSSTNPAATVSTVTTAVSGKEDASNKVTTIRDVSTATDTAYPSEKAVATALAGFSGCTVTYTAVTGELHLDFSGS